MAMQNKPVIKYLNDFLDYLEIEKGLSAKTQENYSRFLQKFFKWLEANDLGSLSPARLTADHVWKYRVFLSRHIDPHKKVGLKKSTQNYYLIALRSFLDFFVEKNIASLPPSKIKLAKDKSDHAVKFLNLGQIERLLEGPDTGNIIGLRDRAILESFFSTGLRISELSSLNRDQLRIKKDTKEIEIAVVGKGSKVRTVYFSIRAVNALRNYLSKRTDLDEALFVNFGAGKKRDDGSWRLSNRAIENIVKKYVLIAGLPIMATPHTLRHSFATDLLSHGVDLRLVQEFLGHRNIATTQIYTHITNKQLRDVHRQMHGGKDLKKQ
ncbi:MAG TPA: tyrosine-type recombinase/integrase [Candidatus Nanoarchaeia archaeon]|nr:tyrosine-type recombinase/integrase [Candidatus Nanoarchaeia archaeon]